MTRTKTAGVIVFVMASLFQQIASAHDADSDSTARHRPDYLFIDFPDSLAVVTPGAAFNPIPGPPPGPNTGWVLYGTSTLKDKAGNVKGKQLLSCATAKQNASLNSEPPGDLYICTHNLTIVGKGTIVLNGAVNHSAFHLGITQSLPIVGGTGDFRAARGEVLTYESDIDPNIHVFEIYLVR